NCTTFLNIQNSQFISVGHPNRVRDGGRHATVPTIHTSSAIRHSRIAYVVGLITTGTQRGTRKTSFLDTQVPFPTEFLVKRFSPDPLEGGFHKPRNRGTPSDNDNEQLPKSMASKHIEHSTKRFLREPKRSVVSKELINNDSYKW
ncbi:Uncharacterized protein FWK35_00018150, partial [Aphis craccivora]